MDRLAMRRAGHAGDDVPDRIVFVRFSFAVLPAPPLFRPGSAFLNMLHSDQEVRLASFSPIFRSRCFNPVDSAERRFFFQKVFRYFAYSFNIFIRVSSFVLIYTQIQ